MKDIDEKARGKKLAAIKAAMKNLDKNLKKKNVVQLLGERVEEPYDCIPTGSVSLDVACGGGGIARGRVVELFGAESSGKSLISQRIVAACQAHGGSCAYIDVEHTFDPGFARKLGVNTDDLFIAQPDHMQDTMKIIDALIDAGMDVIILDSIAALVPQEELEDEAGKQTVGLVARYMSQFMRRVTPKLAKSGGILVCINQVRQKIGVNLAA